MSSGYALRPAARGDAAELAILVDVASRSFATWLWYAGVLEGVTDTALENGRNLMSRSDRPGGWKDAVVASVDGETAGAAIGYLLDGRVAEVVAGHRVLVPILDLQRPLAGHRFIDSIAVYRNFRRRGIARALVEDQIARAGGGAVSLITESYNEAAQSLYRSLGFSEVARREAVPLYENSRSHEWVLMTRNAA